MKKLAVLTLIASSFFTLPCLGATRVAVISDLNGSYGSKTYDPAVKSGIEQIARFKPDLVISTGDMIAGQKAGLDYPGMWNAFHAVVSAPLAQLGIPLAVTPGNHDGTATFKTERSEFIRQWQARTPKVLMLESKNYPLYYAFSVDTNLFVSIDATAVGELPSEQKKWLEQVLSTHSHFKTKTVFGHLPVFPVTDQKTHEFIQDSELIRLFQKHKIDLYLSGHHHAYYPGIHEGIRQIAQGCLGAGPRRVLGTSETSSRSITIIDFEDNGKILVDAYGGKQLDELIDRKTLPRTIEYKSGVMWRDDLGAN